MAEGDANVFSHAKHDMVSGGRETAHKPDVNPSSWKPYLGHAPPYMIPLHPGVPHECEGLYEGESMSHDSEEKAS